MTATKKMEIVDMYKSAWDEELDRKSQLYAYGIIAALLLGLFFAVVCYAAAYADAHNGSIVGSVNQITTRQSGRTERYMVNVSDANSDKWLDMSQKWETWASMEVGECYAIRYFSDFFCGCENVASIVKVECEKQ